MPSQRWLSAITAVFVTSLIVSNIIAVKLISVGPFFLPAGILIFPISYIFGDVLTEVYGYARARRVIWIGFFCNLLAVIMIWLSIQIPPAPFWSAGSLGSSESSQQAFRAILGFTPRLLAASFVAYLCGEFLNSFVLARMKMATRGRHLWLRTNGSTLVAQLADSSIFILLAFYDIIPSPVLGPMIVTQWLTKSAYEAVITPFTYIVVNYLKRVEREDYYDRGTNFNPLILKEENFMTPDQNKTVMRGFLEELDKDRTAIDTFFSPGCLAHLPGNPRPTNRDGFKGFVTLLYTAFPDLHHKVEEQIAENDRVVSLVTARGTHRGDFQGIAPTEKQVIITDIIITRLQGGKAVELWAQFDALGLLQQIGAYQPQGPGGS